MASLQLYEELHGQSDCAPRDDFLSDLLLTAESISPISKPIKSIPQVHSSNIICCSFVESSNGEQLALTGAADKSLCLTRIEDEERIDYKVAAFAAPPLSISINPMKQNLAVVSCMDGSARIFEIDERNESTTRLEEIQCLQDHGAAYVLNAKFSSRGDLLATCSKDKTVRVYSSQDNQWILKKTLFFPETAECLEFSSVSLICLFLANLPQNSLIVGVRGDNRLRLFDLQTLQEKEFINMNTTRDDYVSFTPLDISYSSSLDIIGVSSDKSRAVILKSGYQGPIRALYGAINDEYSTPTTSFDSTGSLFYTTSQDNVVLGWDIGSQNIATRLSGHSKLVRDLDYAPRRNQLLTCSYDRSIRIWGSE